MNSTFTAIIGGTLLLGLSAGLAFASPISDPTAFCRAIADAVMKGDADQAIDLAMANEPDKSRERGAKAAIGTMVNTTKTFASFGPMKFVEVPYERKLGKSVDSMILFYTTTATDIFVRCELHDNGTGWRFNTMTINSDITKLMSP